MWYKQKSGTESPAECNTAVLTTNLGLLWSITEQTYDKMESILINKVNKKTFVYGDVIYGSVLQQIISKNNSKCVHNSVYQDITNCVS